MNSSKMSTGLGKFFGSLRQTTICVQTHCSRAKSESIQKVRQQLEKDIFALALRHSEVIELQKLLMAKDPNVTDVINTFVTLLDKPGFRADVAAFMNKYNDQLLKPSAEKEKMLQEIQCFKDNNCNMEDLQKIIRVAKALVDFNIDPQVSKAWTGILKSQSKSYGMFLKLIGI